MKVQDSSITMNSKYKFYKRHSKKESMKIWVKKPPTHNKKIRSDKVRISAKANKQLAAQKNNLNKEEIKFEMSEKDKHKIRLLEKFIKEVLGKEIKVKIPRKIKISKDKIVISVESKSKHHLKNSEPNWAIEYKLEETYLEKEKMSFKAKGQIITNKGEKIKFSLQLKLNRKFFQQKKTLFQAGNKKLIDPLTINLSGKAPELTKEKISFDLDADQKIEKISFLKPGSGFLALDKNKDGKINDGSELFGPTSGDGFAELAKYDKNKDGWIDEQDPIFDQLKLWTKDEAGNDRLSLLAEHKIGAIYLEKVDSLFSLKNKQNNSLDGQIKETSLYIREDKKVGTIQKIDLTN